MSEYKTDYQLMERQVQELLESEAWYASALSNISAVIMESLPHLNWAGFYLMKKGRLVVGPFQGKPACIHIHLGKGVCGTAAQNDETLLVPDVHAFPGHIACDSASRSEIVIPLHNRDGKVIGVLDIDSPVPDRFSKKDKEGLEAVVRIMEDYLEFR